MSWQKEIEELERRRALARRMGGEEGIARQRKRGKLTVRERLDALADPGSFREFLGLMGHGVYDGERLVEFTPKPSVEGFCRVGGRKIVVTAGDFTVRGGSAGSGHELGSEQGAARRALEWRVPLVRLIDSAGGSVRSFEEIGRTYLPDGNIWTATDVRLLRAVPVVSAVLGSAAGLPAVNACMAHFSLMLRGIGHVFPGGPPVVKAALGYDVTKEDLGGERIHVHESGVIDNLAETEEDAFAQIRRFLSYLPDNVWELPPRGETGDDPGSARGGRCCRRSRAIAASRSTLTPSSPPWSIVDRSSRSPRRTAGRASPGSARFNGFPAGVMCNNPNHLGGATDVAAGEKAIRLIQLCDTFHLPLISLADEPGVMVGLESERQGIERAGARLLCAVCDSTMPWCTIVHAPPLRRRRPVAPPHHRHVPPLRLAVGALGIDAHRGRRLRRLSARDRDRAPIPPPSAARSRRGWRRWRRRSAPPRPPARTSSTRATRASSCASSSRTRSGSCAPSSVRPRFPYRP